MITIKLLSSNPFIENPELLDIWPEASSKMMQEMTLESLAEKEPAIFLIYKDTQVIGITGYILINDETEYVDLRWHGIIKSERGHGYSKKAMTLLFSEIKYIYPNAQYIIEHVPVTNYSEYINEHFIKMGYEKFNEPFKQEWTPHLIQGYKINIDQFLYENTIANNDKIEQHYQYMKDSNLLNQREVSSGYATVIEDPATKEYLLSFPPEVMRNLDWQPNDTLQWVEEANGIFIKNISAQARQK